LKHRTEPMHGVFSVCVRLLASLLTAALALPQVCLATGQDLSVEQIIEKNAEARGGKDAWSRIKTMAWTGYAVNSTEPDRKMPFLLQQQRPHSTRFEIMGQGQGSVRVYSGTDGWKVRAVEGGKPELKPYSAEEMRFASGATVIDGPLMNLAAKRVPLRLLGHDEQQGRDTYLLEGQDAEAQTQRVWVDSQTFCELRLERGYRNASGQSVFTSVIYHDYRDFEGLKLPVVVETGAANDKATNSLVIERVAINPELDVNAFVRPMLTTGKRHVGGVLVDARSAGVPEPAQRANAALRQGSAGAQP